MRSRRTLTHIRRMKHVAIIAVIALALTGCDRAVQPLEYKPERLERDVQQAMCAPDPQGRAEAITHISQKSEGYDLNEVSDVVSEMADKVIEQGCPTS